MQKADILHELEITNNTRIGRCINCLRIVARRSGHFDLKFSAEKYRLRSWLCATHVLARQFIDPDLKVKRENTCRKFSIVSARMP